ncbi:efflux RND transporter permease subunit [uncultured Alistipes sp.]|uniref:efflux RND transporter permease subunit n=1 Tax=uncultured Alistipes sp. TaxID=538949 RepID=UPI0025D567D4|nr:efflux RND transporter permease subunit [uncultured Alistipes sp.]
MNISELSIRRPVLATVLTIIIVLFGVIGYTYLGVREYPSVDNPIISVTCSYPGANADVIENQITEPLEQNINGIPGIRSLSSVSSQGQSRITVEFDLSVDLETAANDVRDKVSRAQRYLPRDCDPPTVAKADADAMPILMVAIQSDKRSLLELSEIADLTVKEQLQTINNVSGVSIWGEKRYSMRLWLDPAKMAGYSITPVDIKNALDRENIELPSGSIEGNTTELTIRTLGLMHTAQEFNDLVIREIDNRIIRMSDVGRAELGPQDTRSYMKMNGIPMVGVVVIPQPGANHIDIADAVYERMETMRKDLPDDIVTNYGFDNTRFIRASISEVKSTVYEAFILVIIIIFLFLRNWRVTLIPCIVIPVSLIGTFFLMYVAGFSINVLSMLAVVLSVGLVVDDAIVMTENIYIRIERGMSPREAGIEGAKEIFFAVISTSITLIAVFLPIVFMEGMTGRLFREFSLVISGAVLISTFAALTVTPMLATKLLVRQDKKNWFYTKTEPFFVGMNNLYSRTLAAFLRRKWIALPIVLGTIALIGWLWSTIPAEMAPLEDRSSITISTRGSEGVTYEYMRDYTEGINQLVDSLIPEASAVTARVSNGSGNVRVALVDIDERERSQMEIAEQLSAAVRTRTEARAFVQQQTTFGGRRGSMPVQYVLQTMSIERLQEILPEFMRQVYDSPVFQMADVDLKFSKPEARIQINRDKANLLGIDTRTIAQTLQYGLSGQRMGYFYMNGKQYEILAEINRQQRNKPADLKSLYVRSSKGEMVQLDNIIALEENVAPPQLYHYNRFLSATVSAGLAKGRTIGQGLDEMDRIAKEVLSDDFRTALAGDSKEFRGSSSSLVFAFVLAIVLIYLILAAQFESFKDPFVIMLTVPLAIAGALIFMWGTGQTMNIFSQIGIIMLIGLVAKNGILIVEFANQKQETGTGKQEAILQASLQRLRPILMTSASTILGLLPLTFATGEGANGRIAMGVAVVGGMLVSTLLTLYIVPAIYSYLSTDRGNSVKTKTE